MHVKNQSEPQSAFLGRDTNSDSAPMSSVSLLQSC